MTCMTHILVATDLSARSDRAVARAVALARDSNAKLTIVHAVDDELPGRIADRLRDDAEKAIAGLVSSLPGTASLKPEVHVVFGRDYQEILRAAEDTGADFIVLGVHRDESSRRMFGGTTAERVIRGGTRPVLMVRERSVGGYKRIMIGVDFSVYSRRAIEFALRLNPEAEFDLLHVFHLPFQGFIGGGRERRHEVSKKHEEMMAHVVRHEIDTLFSMLETKPAKYNRLVKEGAVSETIREQVAERKPDLLVVGTHGRTGVVNALLGSVAQDLLSRPPCDVLAVPAW